VKGKLVDHHRNVVCPFVAIGVMIDLQKCIGHAVTAEIERYDAHLVSEIALVLFPPAQVVLRLAMNKQDGNTVRVAKFSNVQFDASSTSYGVIFHRTILLFL